MIMIKKREKKEWATVSDLAAVLVLFVISGWITSIPFAAGFFFLLPATTIFVGWAVSIIFQVILFIVLLRMANHQDEVETTVKMMDVRMDRIDDRLKKLERTETREKLDE